MLEDRLLNQRTNEGQDNKANTGYTMRLEVWNAFLRRRNGPTEGRTDGGTERRTDGPTDGRTGGRADGRTGGRADRRTDPLMEVLWST